MKKILFNLFGLNSGPSRTGLVIREFIQNGLKTYLFVLEIRRLRYANFRMDLMIDDPFKAPHFLDFLSEMGCIYDLW